MRLTIAQWLFRLARRFERLNTKRAIERAVQLYREASHHGHPEAMYRYAECCRLGIGMVLNVKRACTWCRRSAESGYSIAATSVVGLCRSRFFRDEHIGSSDYWLKLACDMGEPEAMTEMGRIMRDRGEIEVGIALIRRAVELGSPYGMLCLGSALWNGVFLDDDVEAGVVLMFRGLELLRCQVWRSSSFATDFDSIVTWAGWTVSVGKMMFSFPFGGKDLLTVPDASHWLLRR
uniref:Sel1 domain containing protein n=1 Tax=Coptotermes formosanus TaxID=36987 RepID=R4V3U8_COPFO|nr:Sel1 domain containing protein [Coptotermes formosanus]